MVAYPDITQFWDYFRLGGDPGVTDQMAEPSL
jgi:hypothetical protein